MMKFRRELPSLLSQTDVLLEIRDSRLPLTSINWNFEGGASYPFMQLLYMLHRISFSIIHTILSTLAGLED